MVPPSAVAYILRQAIGKIGYVGPISIYDALNRDKSFQSVMVMRTSPFQLLKLSDVLVGVRGFDLLCQ